MILRTGFFAALAAVLATAPVQTQEEVLGTPTGEGNAPAAETTAEAESAKGPLRLEVSLGERRLRVFQGDEEVRSYSVAVGKSNHPTPRGEFGIRRVIWNPRWVPPKVPWARGKTAKGPGEPGNPMGRVKMFFREPDYYIHGTDQEGSLGEAASHGCIRMANKDVVELARLVMEHGGEPREESWFRRILNRVRSSQEVRLSRSVPLVIRK